MKVFAESQRREEQRKGKAQGNKQTGLVSAQESVRLHARQVCAQNARFHHKMCPKHSMCDGLLYRALL